MQNKKFDWLTRLEEIPSLVYVILAIFLLALNTVLCVFTKIDPLICGLIMIVIYGVVSLSVYITVRKRLNLFRLESTANEEQAQSVIYTFRNQVNLPYAVVTEQGRIVTVNTAFTEAVGPTESLFNFDINTLCHINVSELIEISNKKGTFSSDDNSDSFYDIPLKDVRKAEIAEIGERKFRMECHPVKSKGKIYYMIVFHDITELDAIATEHRNQHSVIGYIVI